MLLDYRDPDEFTEVVRPVVPGARFRATGRNFRVRMHGAPMERINLFRFGGPEIHGELVGDVDFFSLTIPTKAGFLAGEKRPDAEFSGPNVHVRIPDRPFGFRFAEPGEMLVLGFNQPVLDTFISGLNADLTAIAPGQDGALSLATPAGAMLRRYLDYVWDEAVNRDLSQFPKAVRAVEDTLMVMTALALDTDGAAVLLPERAVPPAAVRRAVDYISAHFRDPISLAEIARSAAVPVRSLTRAFRESVGMSPMEMVRDRRLEAVRNVLEASEPDQITVTEAALEAGFGHLGRFSSLYRRRFHELPSETLMRRRKHYGS